MAPFARWSAAATLILLAVSLLSCTRKPAERIQTASQMLAEMERIRLEALLCLDTFDIEKLVAMTGEDTPCEVEIERGDPSFGTVQSIGQLHSAATYETSHAEDDILARYQLAILRRLIADSARVVFVEGFQAGSPIPVLGNLRSELAIAFTPMPDLNSFERLNAEQFMVLRNSLAPVVYLALEPRAIAFGADDTTVVRRLIHGEETSAFVADSLRFEHRDRMAMAEVCTYLQAHPGEQVHLVFGAAHIFNRSHIPARTPVPRIVMTTFPGLVAASTVFQAQIVKRLEQKQSLLPNYLERLKDLNPEIFPLLSESGQLHALGKSFVLTAAVPDADSLARFLKRSARTDSVRTAIERGHIAYKSRQQGSLN